ncbi:hypothetical protein [Salinibacillus xinjiangensis]|uniref:Uncharacterized protein n=1 Tax=Salinibacillus xinjiangensis TaxID=1229268 RepID=A0A6G1X8A4_9BACI|nr:hypothetical protein [Salinibacillus xinjiangensis]MRG87135.1 hypothetical protein [Salinibacillus xinjiangensis]
MGKLKVYLHISLLFFTLSALSGVWMRLFSLYPNNLVPYTNVLHGHSHLAILGWAFLGLFVISLTLFWSTLKRRKQAIAICAALAITSLIMFVAFLTQGYAVFSIVMSTLHILIEYWAALFIFREIKCRDASKVATLWIKGALITLIISSLGPFSLGYISANGLKDSPLFDMAIYFYLHFQYNGWLTLGLIGCFALILCRQNIPFHHTWLKRGFMVYFLSLFPGLVLSILWMDGTGKLAEMTAAIGSVGQWIGVIFVLTAFRKSWKSLYEQYSKLVANSLVITFLLFVIKSTMELGLISPTLSVLVYDTRNVIIGYLHLTLLGFISVFILSQFIMLNWVRTNQTTIVGFVLFIVGFTINELLLFIQSLIGWLELGSLPFYLEGLCFASLLLLIGILVLWTSFFKHKHSPV